MHAAFAQHAVAVVPPVGVGFGHTCVPSQLLQFSVPPQPSGRLLPQKLVPKKLQSCLVVQHEVAVPEGGAGVGHTPVVQVQLASVPPQPSGRLVPHWPA